MRGVIGAYGTEALLPAPCVTASIWPRWAFPVALPRSPGRRETLSPNPWVCLMCPEFNCPILSLAAARAVARSAESTPQIIRALEGDSD